MNSAAFRQASIKITPGRVQKLHLFPAMILCVSPGKHLKFRWKIVKSSGIFGNFALNLKPEDGRCPFIGVLKKQNEK